MWARTTIALLIEIKIFFETFISIEINPFWSIYQHRDGISSFKSLSIEIGKTSLKLFEIGIICKIQSLKRFNPSDWSCLDILLSWHGLWTQLNYIYIFWKILNYEKLIHCPIHLVSMLLCMMIYTNRRFRIIILPSFTLYWQYYMYNISCKSECRRYFSIIRKLYLFFPCFLRFSRVFFPLPTSCWIRASPSQSSFIRASLFHSSFIRASPSRRFFIRASCCPPAVRLIARLPRTTCFLRST